MRKPNCGMTPLGQSQNRHSRLEAMCLTRMKDGILLKKCALLCILRSGGICVSGSNASSPLQRGLVYSITTGCLNCNSRLTFEKLALEYIHRLVPNRDVHATFVSWNRSSSRMLTRRTLLFRRTWLTDLQRHARLCITNLTLCRFQVARELQSNGRKQCGLRNLH
jgi:hypothetical protein